VGMGEKVEGEWKEGKWTTSMIGRVQ
jgi:hypothetical protein